MPSARPGSESLSVLGEAYAGPKQTVNLPLARHNWPVTDGDLPRVKEAMAWLWERRNA
ncbi:MAG TPA: hypothetical protein VG269_04735 [Tepidisphaeraceae bacterium]|nr:hypothetical protein [Tepidisphaeraceae bacterium]